ncbi:MAG: DUF2867 domain-containing protein [Xanthomonadales bacterium]|nr:DUF2867 domain-containing protein [Xanthomonadales bacterium]
MADPSQPIGAFPAFRLDAGADAQPIEIHLIAQLAPGSGDRLIEETAARQRAHPAYRDALDEPSVRLAGMHLAHGDPSSLYSFVVGPQGHPFHRHAGPRMFTAISGSSGALLRFSGASDAELAVDPSAFVRALQQVRVPPDSLFSVRFGGGTWHQFLPQRPGRGHAALFALSCHSNELGGALDEALRAQILDDRADIPCLTETVPEPVRALLAANPAPAVEHRLSLATKPDSYAQGLGDLLRRANGRLQSTLARWQTAERRAATPPLGPTMIRERQLPARSLLPDLLAEGHDDCTLLELPAEFGPQPSATRLLARVLEGFVENPPASVGWLMRLRNLLVKPLGLRTATLGCPVSSLQTTDAPDRFVGRYPVLASQVSADDRWAEVILGANDRHLRFRSSVSVSLEPAGRCQIRLATRVSTRNAFGAFYLFAIRRVHERHVAPTLLRWAVGHALAATDPVAPRPFAEGAG